MFVREISRGRNATLQHRALDSWLKMHRLRGSVRETLDLVHVLLTSQANSVFDCRQFVAATRTALAEPSVRARLERLLRVELLCPATIVDLICGSEEREAPAQCRSWELATVLLVWGVWLAHGFSWQCLTRVFQAEAMFHLVKLDGYPHDGELFRPYCIEMTPRTFEVLFAVLDLLRQRLRAATCSPG